MNEALKFRLVGAAVLLIGLGLLWPILFDYDEAMQPEFVDLDMTKANEAAARVELSKVASGRQLVGVDSDATVAVVDVDADSDAGEAPKPNAKAPDITANPQSKPVDERQAAPEHKAAMASAPETVVSNRAITEAQPQLDAQGIPIAYVVQLGTFSSWKNADQLRNQLNQQGYRAYVRPETSVQPGPYRVLVGPVMTFALAEQLNGELKQSLKIGDTFIRRFAQR